MTHVTYPLKTTKLLVRTATEKLEISQLRAELNKEHYLKAGRPAGHVLWQGVYEKDEEDQNHKLVGVLCWGAAAKSLKARDQWIGWDSVTCANRLKLIVQLRRFLVLDSARRPNLASQCMGAAIRRLPDEWEKHHHYQPLMLESFHDPKIHTGTLYKATNWLALGMTKGFKRHRADFYQDAKSPKQLWMKPLKKNSLGLLSQPHALPEPYKKAVAEVTAGARCALSCKQLRSLNEAFKGMKDPRKISAKRHPLGAMMTLICYGLICGAPDVKSIWKKCGALNQNQRRSIGLTYKHKGSGRLQLPGYDAINDFINKIDPKSLAKSLNQWLASHSDLLPKSLAIDGKDLGGKGKLDSIVTLCHQSNGQPLAMQTYSGKKDDCELPIARRLLASKQLNLSNSVVTADALHCQKKRL